MTIICFSHLRWNFVYQRPQHLLSRFAKDNLVYYIEEPIIVSDITRLETVQTDGIVVITPHVMANEVSGVSATVATMISDWFHLTIKGRVMHWFYTPMAIDFCRVLPKPELVVYDCMDELSAFRFAPPELKENEALLFEQADIVFTGGVKLFKAKKKFHKNIYAFPSSIDKKHFGAARSPGTAPDEYLQIAKPRVGYFGVIDERFDIDLLGALATDRPNLQFVIIGPVVKIDSSTLPSNTNIHYLGSKTYNELPSHLAEWDVAIIPFAINESTRFISPTKTPEYLAGGKPVVSTPIHDVITPYSDKGLVFIAGDAAGFSKGIDWAMEISKKPAWLSAVDEELSAMSWDQTYSDMLKIINDSLKSKQSEELKPIIDEYV